MEQKKSEHARCVGVRDGIQAKRVKQLLHTLDSYPPKSLSARLQEKWMGSDGLRPLAAAMTILLTDYGGTTPSGTCEEIARDVPSLYHAWGYSRVLAVCEEIQRSEIPEQSALFQRMFQRFNIRYFAGRLSYYRVRVVYDVWYWETVQCGHPEIFPPAAEELSFIDYPGRQIFIRFLGFHTCGLTMAESLIEEMANAAIRGGYGANRQAEMARLKDLGAPVRDHNF